jgi:hypothetical protein
MTISEAQFDTWAQQGPTPQFVTTYNSIRTTLVDSKSPYYARSFDVHLQGSYGNDTNVRGDSDVDTVIWTKDTFDYDIDQLPADQQAAFRRDFSSVTSAGPSFKSEVLSWLRTNYGSDVDPGRKAINIKKTAYRRAADVVACVEHRRYYRYENQTDAGQAYHLGISFHTSDGTKIINFPKEHQKYCTAKHQATNGYFKPTVRIFKNMRNRMIDRGIIQNGLAPSYFIEGMLWNVPDDKYGTSYQATVVNCLNWLHGSNRTDLKCAHQLFYLLRDNVHNCWPAAKFEEFLSKTIKFYNDGG